MITIGDLARRTDVSVRMLRHYDSLGLLEPARTDSATGYRHYAPSQEGRVAAILALRDLGFSLADCRVLLRDGTPLAEITALLQHRRMELEEQITADQRRLADIEDRLTAIDQGRAGTTDTLRLTALPALHLLVVHGQARDESEIGHVLASLRAILTERAGTAGIASNVGTVATYAGRTDIPVIDVAVGIRADPHTTAPDGFDTVTVPAEARAAVVRHRQGVHLGDAWNALDDALAERGLTSTGTYRHMAVTTPDGQELIELQVPVRPLRTGC
ncbi:DNA-binding transcriptional regulator, MerR family [Ruania alba]|uniref:DNA-binding transcriptional regulator, MerR family n=2 Tax=Ruania alba TaxID=648782 RepID=A0A1H5D5V8_9MICO|nr:DNA-binding transcriptional regulator, MerR family [Ruania alba]